MPQYKVTNRKGPDHDPVYVVMVKIIPDKSKFKPRDLNLYFQLSSHNSAVGKGKRTKIAEMNAAKELCKILGLSYN